MRYQGGKSRIAKPIAELISQYGGGSDTFVSLFCGTCSIEARVTGFNKVICNDKHEYLIEMLRAAQNGYEFPEFLSEEEYKYIKEHKDENKALTGFVGFGCSFGGKWFGGYARAKDRENFCGESKRSLAKDMQKLMSAEFLNMDYRDVPLPEGCVVLADPPYANVTQYGEIFDSNSFWDHMRNISKDHLVFICEQTAPDDFTAIWEKPFLRQLDVNKNNQFKVTEKLWVPISQKER